MTQGGSSSRFLGLINYFKNWIDGYARICAPLSALRKTNAPWADASAFAIGGWIGQIDEKGEGHPIVYWSCRMLDRELNFSVYEQELLTLVEMLPVGRPYLDGQPFKAQTDHRALQWLQTQSKLSKRQAGSIERIQGFDMTIEYVPGKTNHVADILSRCRDFMPNCLKC